MKKIISVFLILVMCLGLVACGNGGKKNKEYNSAVYSLESILESSCLGYTQSELHEQQWLDYGIDISQYMNLPDLYQKFSDLDNYKQSKEILSRFSVVDNGHVTIKQNSTDAFGQVQSREDAVLIDAQGRVAVVFHDPGYGTIYAYDEKGNLIREGHELIHKYNDRGERIETSVFNNDGLVAITNYSYGAQGNCVEETTKYADGTTETITFEYNYDEQGKCTEKIVRNTLGEMQTTTYTYIVDEQGNCLFKFSEIDDNIYVDPTFTVYSKTGNVIFCTYLTAYSNKEISDYKYENGLPVSITFSDGSELTFEYAPAYFFDVEGFVLPEV